MRNALREIPFALVMALTVASIVMVLVPTCSMASSMCGPMGAPLSGGALDLGAILDCEGMYFSTDAPGALLVQMLTFVFVAVAAALVLRSQLFMQTAHAYAYVDRPDPDPPPDTLMGRLLI